MSRSKKKIVLKKLPRIKPRRKFAPVEITHTDKSKYDRKLKHSRDEELNDQESTPASDDADE